MPCLESLRTDFDPWDKFYPLERDREFLGRPLQFISSGGQVLYSNREVEKQRCTKFDFRYENVGGAIPFSVSQLKTETESGVF